MVLCGGGEERDEVGRSREDGGVGRSSEEIISYCSSSLIAPPAAPPNLFRVLRFPPSSLDSSLLPQGIFPAPVYHSLLFASCQRLLFSSSLSSASRFPLPAPLSPFPSLRPALLASPASSCVGVVVFPVCPSFLPLPLPASWPPLPSPLPFLLPALLLFCVFVFLPQADLLRRRLGISPGCADCRAAPAAWSQRQVASSKC